MKAPEQKPQPKTGKEETAVRKKEDESSQALSKPDVDAKNQKGTEDTTEGNAKKAAELRPDTRQETNTQTDREEKEPQPVQDAADDKDSKDRREIKADNERPEVARNSAA